MLQKSVPFESGLTHARVDAVEAAQGRIGTQVKQPILNRFRVSKSAYSTLTKWIQIHSSLTFWEC
jgi:hypothetical protein